MRFFDKVLLNKKLASISFQRNMLRQQQPESVATPFAIIPLYLGVFFQNVSEDEGDPDVLHTFARAREDQLDAVGKLLAFWWFWSLDRLEGQQLLQLPEIREGLRDIWGLEDSSQDHLTQMLDSSSGGKNTSLQVLWQLLCSALGKDISYITVSPLLHHAQMSVLRDPEGTLQRVIAS